MRYDDAARLRDELAQLNERVENATSPVAPSPASLQLRLGQVVRHVTFGYRYAAIGRSIVIERIQGRRLWLGSRML